MTAIAGFAGFLGIAEAAPPRDPIMGGQMRAVLDGRAVSFPLLRTDIEADITGDLASVVVVQTFANPGTVPLNATYLFPLDDKAAVYRMTMETGDEIVEAQIAPRAVARVTYERAKAEGRNATLLDQHRPNMFTQEVANLMPGAPIKVSLRYAQTVAKVDGFHELVLPLVVGPRYEPTPEQRASAAGAIAAASPGPAMAHADTPSGQWSFGPAPLYPPVSGLTIPSSVDPDRAGIVVHLDGGVPIAEAASPTHALTRSQESATRWTLALASGRTIDNRDFVLRYRLAGSAPQAGLLARHDERGGFFSLLIEPPAMPQEAEVTPREMVFVLDCSGSMYGLPLNASKEFMRRALAHLRPSDSFRIIRFSDDATSFSARPLQATPANLRRAAAYVESLTSEGGTNMSTGILQALAVPPVDGSLRIVTFLTDGYIGNEDQILQLIHAHLGEARLFAFGVGAGVNRFLLNEMGRVGRGFTRYMDPTEDVGAVADELVQRLQSPVLTDIAIDWGGLDPRELTLDNMPDLFAGQSVRIQGRYDNPGRYHVRVTGKVNGRPAELPLTVELPGRQGGGEAIPLIWARMSVEREMRRLLMPAFLRPGGLTDDAIRDRVTRLGLDFGLVTQWTSFVAVAHKVADPAPHLAIDADVPLAQVAGVAPSAYGLPVPSMRADAGFTGNAAPEPQAYLGLVLVAAALAWAAWWTSRRPA